MEGMLHLVNEAWSNSLTGACPVLMRFVRAWNSGLSSEEARVRCIRPLVARLANTRSTRNVEELRSWLAFDWLVRERTPQWLELAPAPEEHAAALARLQRALRELPPIHDLSTAMTAGATLSALEDDAMAIWNAARTTVGRTSRSVAADSVRATAWSAAWDASALARDSSAAWNAASGFAWAAAWDTMWVARAAAWGASHASGDVAREYLAPTVKRLQDGALDLVERMLAVTPAQSGDIEDAA